MPSTPTPRPPPPPLRIGNDVVDLRHRSCLARGTDSRFRARILAPPEADWVGDSPLRLWCAWAAKETGFKVASKLLDPIPVFRYRAFASRLKASPEADGTIRLEGEVDTPAGPVHLVGSAGPRAVHLVGWNVRPQGAVGGRPWSEAVAPAPEPDALLESWRPRFSAEEWEGVHSPASAVVRIEARRELARLLGIPPESVEILTSGERPGRTPPRVRVAGEPRPDLDLSISHHGEVLAWAVLHPDPDQNPGR